MTGKRIVTACCVLLLTTSISAQPPGAKPKSDPISGTWTGQLVRQNASDRIPITMELKFDGKSAVSGTVSGLPNPADVKVGRFDPKNGALKLQLGKKGEPAILLTLEGTVAKGTAAGRVSGDLGGEFKMTRNK